MNRDGEGEERFRLDFDLEKKKSETERSKMRKQKRQRKTPQTDPSSPPPLATVIQAKTSIFYQFLVCYIFLLLLIYYYSLLAYLFQLRFICVDACLFVCCLATGPTKERFAEDLLSSS